MVRKISWISGLHRYKFQTFCSLTKWVIRESHLLCLVILSKGIIKWHVFQLSVQTPTTYISAMSWKYYWKPTVKSSGQFCLFPDGFCFKNKNSTMQVGYTLAIHVGNSRYHHASKILILFFHCFTLNFDTTDINAGRDRKWQEKLNHIESAPHETRSVIVDTALCDLITFVYVQL